MTNIRTKDEEEEEEEMLLPTSKLKRNAYNSRRIIRRIKCYDQHQNLKETRGIQEEL